jgi:queuine tRNA-ribosyltransferase
MYFPDATYGAVRSTSSQDLKNCGLKGIVVNTYHLFKEFGINRLKKLGGLHRLMNWPDLIVSDSGGFQLLSLFYKDRRLARITDKGIILFSGPKNKSQLLFSPKLSLATQFAIGADIMICLDDCPPINTTQEQLALSVKRTILWAKESKNEFEKLCHKYHYSKNNRPILLAVIQGGSSKKLRTKCAQALIKMDFDGYAFGGWPMKKNGGLDLKTLRLIRNLTPKNKPLFALGIGKPQDIIACRKIGYDLFDCVLPTRDARHGRVYLNSKARPTSTLSIEKSIYENDLKPLDRHCSCFTCQNHSRAYLRHLFKSKETGVYRLLTIHNLTAYANLINFLK